MLQDYKKHCEERKEQGIPPLPLSAQQTSSLVELLKSEHDESELLLELLKERIPAGVDQAAYVKAGFLADITTGKTNSPYISKKRSSNDSRNNAWWIQYSAFNKVFEG